MEEVTERSIPHDDNRIWLSFPDFWKMPRSKYVAEVMCQEFWKIIDQSKLGQSGMSSNGVYTELNLDTDRVVSKFRIWNIPNEFTHDLVVSIAGVEEDCQKEEAFWRKVLTVAIARIHSDPESYPWECVIGPIPDPYSATYRLDSIITMGNLKITPADRLTWESQPSLTFGMTGGYIYETWPAWISGKTSTYYEFELPSLALEEANIAGLILTLGLNQAWAPRFQPQVGSGHQIEIPAYSDSAGFLKENDALPSDYESIAIEVDISQWCSDIWTKLQSNSASRVRRSMFMFREGITLAKDHPSLARVAFVAAVEALPRPKSKKCEECGSPIGLTNAYKEAISVADAPYISQRLQTTYNSRSRTVHDGRVSKGELASNLSIFMNDPRDFAPETPVGLVGVGTLRNRTRELIMEKLGVCDPLIDSD